MTLISRTWSRVARARRKYSPNRPPLEDWLPSQIRWIQQHAPGKSFADIGGLFMKAGDFAFAAEAAGAISVTCFDGGDPDLTEFVTKHTERSSSVRFVQGDLEEPATVERVGVHDIVWCTGVIYHTPNPMTQLFHLRGMTRELLYLGTITIPEIPGFPQACVWWPYLDDGERMPYAAGYNWSGKPGPGLLGVGKPIKEEPMSGYANCYFGLTVSALRAMLRTARFEVVEERRVHSWPYITEIVARPIPMDPLMPPVTYFRERGELREATGERLPWHDYYDRKRAGDIAGSSTSA